MYAINGKGNAWMKIMGIGDQGGKTKKEKNTVKDENRLLQVMLL